MITPSGYQEQELLKLGRRLLDPLARAWDIYHQFDPSFSVPLRDGSRASCVTDHLLDQIGIDFDEDPMWHFEEDQQLKYLRSSFAVVRCNKFDQFRLPRRNSTDRSRQWQTGTLPLPEIGPLFALQFGYVVDPTWMRITQAALTQQYGSNVVWASTYEPDESQNDVGDMPAEFGPRRVRLKEDKLFRQREIEDEQRRSEADDEQQQLDGGE